MSIPVSSTDLRMFRAGDPLEEQDREINDTIPIRVPLHTTLDATESTPPATPLSDAELLTAFVERRDADAFTEIVQRYRQMVYRVAFRAVEDRHLADDVFQATFLVLAQTARKIKSGEVLSAWLHGTARNIARRALSNQHTERQRLAQLATQTLAEKGGEMSTSTAVDPFDELVRRHEQQLLDEELQQLPEASRAPLVLYYLEEKSQAEIAQLMGLTVEAVEGRLKRAKQELRARLIRRGVLLSTVVAAATVLTPAITAAAPSVSLVSATVTTALGTTALGSTALTATAVTGTATSTTLTAGATTAAHLAAQEVAAMSAASKATAILLTTAVSTTIATGLVFGAIAGSLMSGNGTTPVVSTSPADEWASPMNIVQHESGPNPFALEGEEPVLLALAEPEGATETNSSAPAGNDIDLAKLIQERDELIAQKESDVLKWQKAYRDEQVAKERVRDELARQSKELNERIERLNQIVDDQRKQLDELQNGGWDVPDGEFTKLRKYDVSDIDPSLRDKFVAHFKLGKSATFRDNVMEIRAMPEDFWLYEGALELYRKKRDEGKLQESEFDAMLSELRVSYALSPRAALRNMHAADRELADRKETHGPLDQKLVELQRRVDLWRAVYEAVRTPSSPEALVDNPLPKGESSPENKPVVYTMSALSIDHQWIALEYARSLAAKVESHDAQRAFIVRTNDEVHGQIQGFLKNLQNADYEMTIECVSQQLAKKLKRHSDNHPDMERLRDLLSQLERVHQEYRESQVRALNEEPCLRLKKLRFFSDEPADQNEFR